MARWFWYFLIYSFLGFCIEVIFNRVTHGAKQDRKCRYFLPLCPVYGLGAVALLLLPVGVQRAPLLLFPAAALACTAVEYLTGLFYERVALVSFWDYSHLPLNLGGKVCLLFSLFWGVLAMVLFSVVHPVVAGLVAVIPTAVTLPVALFATLDSVLTLLLLRRAKNTDVLRWYRRPRRQRRSA